MKFLCLLSFSFSTLLIIQGCKFIDIQSDFLGGLRFHPLPNSAAEAAGVTSGRTVFATKQTERTLYLYHILSEPSAPGTDGVGRWVLNDNLGVRHGAIAYVNSWAVLPHLIGDIQDADKSVWILSKDGQWSKDESLTVRCIYDQDSDVSVDSTVYFQGGWMSLGMSGFYLETVADPSLTYYRGPLYSQVKVTESDNQLYLYRNQGKWIIGDEQSIDSDSGFAYTIDDASHPTQILSEEWVYVHNNTWMSDFGKIIASTPSLNIYDALHEYRSMKFIPSGQKVTFLRNGVVMPLVGLGTGALSPDNTSDIIDIALRLGYRSLDLAREYRNELTVSVVLSTYKTDNITEFPLPNRTDIFLISKVWPTHLGYEPTSKEISRSINDLGSPYVDMYFIHWPS